MAALSFYTSFYLSKGDLANAKKALDKASSYVGNSLVEKDYAINTYLAVKARYYKAAGDIPLALRYINEVLETERLPEDIQFKADILKEQGRLEEVMALYDELYRTLTKRRGTSFLRQVNQLRTLHELHEKELKETELKEAGLRIARKQDLLVFILSISVVLSILLYISFLYYRHLRSLKNQLQREKDLLLESQRRLMREKARAEEASLMKSAFLANMSHEIRTPLNAIVGFAHLVTETTNASEQREYFSIINKNCDLLLKLINDILDLSKIESGRLNYNVSEVELRDICQEAYVVQSLKMTSDVALLYNSVAMPSVRLWIDPHRVEQVLLNLLSNAIKFTSKGFISLFYEVEDMFVRVSVMDTGIGISEEKLESVFERFVKLDDFYQGAGLGLPICKMIVEQLGGEIGVRSELGKGSTFWFTLPLVVTDKAVVEKDDPSVLSECQLY